MVAPLSARKTARDIFRAVARRSSSRLNHCVAGQPAPTVPSRNSDLDSKAKSRAGHSLLLLAIAAFGQRNDPSKAVAPLAAFFTPPMQFEASRSRPLRYRQNGLCRTYTSSHYHTAAMQSPDCRTPPKPARSTQMLSSPLRSFSTEQT